MTPSKLVVVLAIGLGAAACTTHTTETVLAPSPGPYPASVQACTDYGFTPGTMAFDRCVSREHAARLQGRVVQTYAQSQVVADARDACYSYGLTPGTGSYDRCVGREVDDRRYNDTAAVVSTSTYSPAYGETVVTTTSTPAPVYVPPAPPQPPAGVQAFRDEYGFRYDGQGNRVDARGNIISPHSTQP
jgi:hypothetical protein